MMRADANIKLRSLNADGGPTHNKFLMQFTADLTQTEIKVADVAENSAWGTTMNGLLGLGVYQSLDELAKLPRKQTIFWPAMKPAAAKQLHDGWQAAVKRVL
jgi:glycerol kinase